MADLKQLETELLKAVDAATDEAALEAVRVAALGKKGSVSALLKTLGTMAPDERKQGPADQRPQGPRHAKRSTRKSNALQARRSPRGSPPRSRCHAAGARERARARPHPSGQPGDRRDHRDFRRHGLLRRRRAGHRDAISTISPRSIFPKASGARDARTFFFNPKPDGERKVLRTHTSPVQIRTMEKAEAADPRHHAGPHLSHPTPTRPTRRCSTRSKAW